MNNLSPLAPVRLKRVREGLTAFYEGARGYMDHHGGRVADGSQAEAERSAFARPQSLVTVSALAETLIEASGEHVTAFVKTITEPIEAIACWTCVRSMLESAAIAAWLFDPALDEKARVSRAFALRYEGLEQQLTFARAAKLPQGQIAAARLQIDNLEIDALAIGYTAVTNRKGERNGVGEVMPNTTDIIDRMLNKGREYRLLSAVAHGHWWAISQLGFAAAKDAPDVSVEGVMTKAFRKAVNVQGIQLLGITAARAIGIALWNQCRYNGWDQARLTGLLETLYDKWQTGDSVRFWR